MESITQSVNPAPFPLPGGLESPPQRWSLDDVAEQLSALRVQGGSPSYSVIARRIRQLRVDRGLPPGESEPGRITVYDCFRQGRRRMQPELVADIVLALGASPDQANLWAQACTVAQMQADAAAVVTVRTELPSSPGPFVGRTDQIDQVVRTAVHSPGSVMVLHGMPGSGKSRLAFRSAAALLSAGLARRVLVAELRGHHARRPPAAPAAVLDALLRAAGVPGREVPAAVADRRALLASKLTEERAVLVLDDAHDVTQVRALLPSSAAPVLITSRHRLPELSTQLSLPIGTLDQAQAVELLAHIAGLRLSLADQETAVDLVRAAGLLPLSIGLLAARVAARPDWSLTDHLQALQSRRQALRLDDDVEVALHLSYRHLDDQMRHGLRMLATHPCDELDPLACAALLGLEPEDAAQTLQRLSEHHLVVERSPQRYGLHDLTRTFALARSYDEERPADRGQALARLHAHLAGSVRSAAAQLGIGGEPRLDVAVSNRHFEDEKQAAAWVTQEFETLLALSAHGLAHGHPRTSVQISEDLGFWLIRCAERADLADLHEYALGAAERLGDEEGVARAALAIGQVLVRESRFAEAIPALHRAATAFATAGDRLGASRATTALAMIDVHQGRLEAAIARFTEVVEATKGTAAFRHGIALDNLAVAYIRAGRLQEALACQQESLLMAEESGDTYTRANVLANMASVHQQRGAAAEAHRAAEESLALSTDLDSVPITAYALSTQGRALVDLGRLDEAEPRLRRAEELATGLHDQVLLCGVTGHLATLAQHQGEVEQARAGFVKARDLAAAVGAAYEEACASRSLGELALAHDDPQTARQHWAAALETFETMGSPEAARVRSLLQAVDHS
ncbi:tetratricopeptide repeat protein [Ornithinimicrobium pratense]|uniref:Tetratricopeptide repeat protein n=1 Tax=Ornithinimicrobium pratense TaxID=2593973 RepID=A0A5J6V627_9MICO|nr:tetratricopeptide repeat protein [Ornithinimicrobium pratense]QFG69460.1 tetratricopeptide repeat protein [Ornithinimicrobium pratense]